MNCIYSINKREESIVTGRCFAQAPGREDFLLTDTEKTGRLRYGQEGSGACF